MATWEAYWIAAVTYVVWMVVLVILRGFWGTARPLILDLGGDMFATEVGYIDAVLANWVLIGITGIFISVLAAGVLANNRGGIA